MLQHVSLFRNYVGPVSQMGLVNKPAWERVLSFYWWTRSLFVLVQACSLNLNVLVQSARLDRQKVLSGTSDSNIQFSELCQLLFRLDFKERIKGDHHIFTKQDIDAIINIQPKEGKAKPYQVKQVRNLILKYKLGDMTNE